MGKFVFVLVLGGIAQLANAQSLVGYTFSEDNKANPFPLQLNPFTTDGCTKYDDGPQENPSLWQHCCLDHDAAYWLGGTEAERKHADDRLYECVKATNNPSHARVMYVGTRAGGGPLGHNTYRWGFGWNRIRDYKALTQEELDMAYSMYGDNLEVLKKDLSEKKYPIIVPKNYDYVSPFPYSFCEEEIINYLSPKLKRATTVTKFKDYEITPNYIIKINLDICDEGLEFKFKQTTTTATCKKDYNYSGTINKFEDVKISKKCLARIGESR